MNTVNSNSIRCINYKILDLHETPFQYLTLLSTNAKSNSGSSGIREVAVDSGDSFI